METKINEEAFKLKKVKFDGKKISIDYEEKTVNKKGVAEMLVYTVESDSRLPHQDLINGLSMLREPLMRSLRYYDMKDVALEFLGADQKKKVTDKFLDLVNDVEVTGISIGGSNQLKGVVITGKIKNEVTGKSSLNSPRIVFASDKLGYEDIVEQVAEKIGRECYNYVYSNKKAVKDLFDEEDQKVPAKANLKQKV